MESWKGETTESSSPILRTVSETEGQIQVTLQATPETTVSVYAVQDGVPSGMSAGNIGDGVFDAANGFGGEMGSLVLMPKAGCCPTPPTAPVEQLR